MSAGWPRAGCWFAIFAVIWVTFGAALVWSQGSIDQAWATIRDLPPLVQGVAWVVLLPAMIGLWVWETSLPLNVASDRAVDPAEQAPDLERLGQVSGRRHSQAGARSACARSPALRATAWRTCAQPGP